MASSLSIRKSWLRFPEKVFLFCGVFHWRSQAQPSQKTCAWEMRDGVAANFVKICRSGAHFCHGSAVAEMGNFVTKQL